jgi:RNA polymerase sigma-70 factor, ECF subfamily
MIGSSFAAVLSAAQTGDEQAFAVLWRDLQPALLRYLRVALPTEADDLAADTWMSVIRGLARFQGDERHFRAWVFTLARHRTVDWHRQTARRQVEVMPVEMLGDRPAPDDPAAAALEAQSTRAALTLIAELPGDQAEVVALRVLADLDVAEVARIVGKRPGAVRVLAHRGLRRLATRLESAGLARPVTQ